ncbi:MAG: helix-turn-helix transcriptional regulator [Stellaceae bacterium]
MAADRYLSYPDLRARGIPYCREWLNKLIERSEFPSPVAIGHNRIAWRESDIDSWLASRPLARPGAGKAA